MRAPTLLTALVLSLTFAFGLLPAAELPPGYWPEDQVDEILDKTLTIRLAPDLSDLSSGEKAAVEHLIEVGKIFQKLFENQRHHQAEHALSKLRELHAQTGRTARTAKLLDLYRLSKGPIATTLDNRRVPFLPVDEEIPGKNLYPLDITREEMDRFMESHPGRREALLHLRGIVRRGTLDNVEMDLKTLGEYPVLDRLHPGLHKQLENVSAWRSPEILYAVPYSVAWPKETMEIFDHLNAAADKVEDDDPGFARFLRLRARDLLADDYDGGDAAWITGRFKHLNAQIGSYETYDDSLYGVKSFFSLVVMKRDIAASEAMAEAVKGLQAIEDALPYEGHKKVREDLPIGVYDVVADFAQSRGTNTATILPNESHLARQYGRTIMLRSNILKDPDLFARSAAAFRAAVAEDQGDDMTADGSLQRVLWHEIGHYLGVDRTADGRELDTALQDASDLLEEMKSDLVSLFAVEPLKAQGYYDEASARSVYAGGIRRVIQRVKPRRTQPYQTMQLMQWNWFLDRGVLTFDPVTGRMRIDYARYPAAVRALLKEVLAVQRAGDRDRAEAFVKAWTTWTDDLHEVTAARMKSVETTRYTIVRYAALGE